MIEKQHGQQTLVCDDCEETQDDSFAPEDFNAMIAAAKAEGWTIKPDGDGGWQHYCGYCNPSSLAAQRRLLGMPARDRRG